MSCSLQKHESWHSITPQVRQLYNTEDANLSLKAWLQAVSVVTEHLRDMHQAQLIATADTVFLLYVSKR